MLRHALKIIFSITVVFNVIFGLTFAAGELDVNAAGDYKNYSGGGHHIKAQTVANTTAGSITGNWTLTTGSRLTATYADLAERFSADDVYTPGTVVELGGKAEITAVKYELSEDVFGVISDNMAFLMNNGAGDNATHPAVAMTGRVRVKTLGTVRKGQRLVRWRAEPRASRAYVERGRQCLVAG